MYFVGNAYYFGRVVEQSFTEAVAWLSKAEMFGHGGATVNLATCYYRGQGVEQDYVKAFNLYAKGFKRAKPLSDFKIAAALRLAECFAKGRGVEANEEEAKRWEDRAQREMQERQRVERLRATLREKIFGDK